MKKGQRVRVYNRTWGGTVIVEGIAVLVEKVEEVADSGDLQYWDVEFENERGTLRARWVKPQDVIEEEDK